MKQSIILLLLCALLVLGGCSAANGGAPAAPSEADSTSTAEPEEQPAPPAEPVEPAPKAEPAPQPEPDPVPAAGEGEQPPAPAEPGQSTAFPTISGSGSVTHSGSFQAADGETLTLTATSDMAGGTVDFFLFDPQNREAEHIVFTASEEVQVPLSAGTWAYNCTGFFEHGSFSLDGTIG